MKRLEAVGDFNGDGILDVAETSPFVPNGSAISIGLVDGGGAFQSPQTYPTLTQCEGMVAGNFTPDRNFDLAVTIDSALQIFAGLGDGTFTSGSLSLSAVCPQILWRPISTRTAERPGCAGLRRQ